MKWGARAFLCSAIALHSFVLDPRCDWQTFFHTHTQRNYVAFEYFKTQRSLPEFIFFFNLLKARSHIFTTDLRLDLVYSFTFSFIFFVLKSDPSYVDEHTHIISVRSTKKYFIFDFCLNSINKKKTQGITLYVKPLFFH